MKILKSAQFWLLLIPFLIWMYCFRFYLSGSGGLFADAISYYQHIGFFTDHLARGQYPLWDPFWYEGAPYHFFLRRIGEFNPFYLILVVMKFFGATHPVAYLTFLTVYYALAVIGFYLVVKYVLRDQTFAYLAYLLLLFSSWGTQLFYNYIILLFVPLVWFFYFFIRFLNEQRRSQWLGICFCLGITLTTYIPFYFITILTLFMFLAVIFYFKDIPQFLLKLFSFFRANIGLAVLSSVFLIVCCYPGYVLYVESKAGEFVMPSRSAGAETVSAVAVSLSKVASGDFVNNSSFDKYFDGLDRLLFGDFFIPYAFLLFLILAAFARLNKVIVMTFLMIGALLIISITESSVVHQWLYEHIFFFKFIRNIYYFFWLAILPLAIFWVCVCLRSIENELKERNCRLKRIWVYLGIIILIVPQSVYVSHVIVSNMRSSAVRLSHKAVDYSQHRFREEAPVQSNKADTEQSLKVLQSDLYYASRWYAQLTKSVDPYVLGNYGAYPLYLYDSVKYMANDEDILKTMQSSIVNFNNTAIVDSLTATEEDQKLRLDLNEKVDVVKKVDPRVQWIKFSPNDIKIRFTLDRAKFLVINNNYHSSWRAMINDKPVKLFKANYAFQGVWLPAGVSVLQVTFETLWTYLWHISIFIAFILMFVWLVREWMQKR